MKKCTHYMGTCYQEDALKLLIQNSQLKRTDLL